VVEAASGRFIPRAAITFMGLSLGAFELGTAGKRASLAIRLWGPGATNASPGSSSNGSWLDLSTIGTRGRRPRPDTGCVGTEARRAAEGVGRAPRLEGTPPAPELSVLDPNRCHHAVDHRLSRLPRTRHREQVRICPRARRKDTAMRLKIRGRVAADGKHRSHPVVRDGNHPRPSRKDQQPRSRSSRARRRPGTGALGKSVIPPRGST